MAQESMFWETTGVGDGPSAGYTMANFIDLLLKLFTTDQQASQGVLRGVGGELAISGSASPLSLADGAAITYGLFYENTDALALTVTTPIVGVTGGRVNLKVDWSTQTVRAAVQLNTDGVAAIPALVQTAGSEWNLPIATFTISPAGTISLTDARTFCQFASVLAATEIIGVAALSVLGRASNSAGLVEAIVAGADGLVLRRSGNALLFGQVGAPGIADDAITQDKIADGAVGSEQIANGAIGTANIADGAIDDTKVGPRVATLTNRQGNAATAWNSPGTNNYTPGLIVGQIGIVAVSFGAAETTKSVTITFPEAFDYAPLVLATMQIGSGMNPATTYYTILVVSTSATQATLQITRSGTADGAVSAYAHWITLGPENV